MTDSKKQALIEKAKELQSHPDAAYADIARIALAALTAEPAGELEGALEEAKKRITELERQLSIPVCLPYCSSSPVCEIEAGYANGVNDCKNAIRKAGYPIEGDD